MMGDNISSDKLNYAPNMGINFGFPYYDDEDLPDPISGKLTPTKRFYSTHIYTSCSRSSAGDVFYTGNMFPDAYRNAIFIAEHGSWNLVLK